MTHVVAVLKLAQILRKMLPRDVNMRSANRPLDHRPEAFKAIGVRIAANIFLCGVINRAVNVPLLIKTFVRAVFICADKRRLFDIRLNMREQSFMGRVRHNLGHYIAVALQHPENDGLAERSASARAGADAADIGFVGFHVARERLVAVCLTHVKADQVRHAEGRGVAHAKLALQFLRGNAVTGRGEQVDGIKPFGQGRVTIGKNCALHWMNVVAAIACVGWVFGQLPKLADLAAFRAAKVIAVAHLEQMRQARIVVRKLLEKVLNCQVLGHIVSPYETNIVIPSAYVNFIYAQG